MGAPTPTLQKCRRRVLLATVALLAVPSAVAQDADVTEDATCPGALNLEGYGQVQVVPTGWRNMTVPNSGTVSPQMGGRAYFADKCKAGVFNNEDYLALNLLGKTMSFTTDLSGAGCGCNAAFYLTNMRQNTEVSECHDYYCDANNVCGESCAEIDIMEGNMFAYHSTLHSAHDHDGKGVGYGGGSDSSYAGWNGPRQWTAEEYAPNGRCIDTNLPYSVSVSFPTNAQGNLEAMEVVLSQIGKGCPLAATITNYEGNAELTSALTQGMTPIVSYWSDKGMLWLDGQGKDHKGACRIDHPDQCTDSVKFYDFAIKTIDGAAVTKADVRGSTVASSDTPAAAAPGPTPWWQPAWLQPEETTAPTPAPWQATPATTPAPTTLAPWQTTAATTLAPWQTTAATTPAPWDWQATDAPTPAPWQVAPTQEATTTTAWWQAPTTVGPTTTAWWQAPTEPPTSTKPPVQYSSNGYIQSQFCDCSWLNEDNCQDTGGCATSCRDNNDDPGRCKFKRATAAANRERARAAEAKEEAEAAKAKSAEEQLATELKAKVAEEEQKLQSESQSQEVSKAHAEALRVEKAKLEQKKAAAMMAAFTKAMKEREENPSLPADTCFREGGQYAPINMEGQPRSTEVDAAACQHRCSRTLGCARFTYSYMDGGCHLHDSESKFSDGDVAGLITGPSSCKADAYCHEYIDVQSCGWTINHNCAGQIPGKLGLAYDDGSRGFECCCKYQMWKSDVEASKRSIPEAPQDVPHSHAPLLCKASHGHTLGDAVCCGQDGFVMQMSHVCPQERPTCVGLVAHETWGTCQLAEGWQQCGGMKDGMVYMGPSTCPEGFVCKEWSKDYSQCYKAGANVIMMKYSAFDLQSLFRSGGSPAITMGCAALLCAALAGLALRRRRIGQAHVPAEEVREMLVSLPESEVRPRLSSDSLPRPSIESLLCSP